MCGRMTLTRSGSEIADYFSEAMQSLVLQAEVGPTPSEPLTELDGAPLRPRFNLAPSQDSLTVVSAPNGTGSVGEFAWKRWGLVPAWAKDVGVGARLFNARSETVDVKPSFRAAFKSRRCLIVVDGFYEWTPRNRDHQPFHFQAKNGQPMAFAGLHERWQGEGGELVESCTVLTCEANEDLQGVHHRMPVVLERAALATWVDPGTPINLVKALARPAPSGRLERKAVGRQVNDPRRDDVGCLEAPGSDPASVSDSPKSTGEVQPDLFAFAAESKEGR